MKTLEKVWIVRKLGNHFLGFNKWLWNKMPSSATNARATQQYGRLMHKLVLKRNWRQPSHGTYMLRNRAEMAMIHQLAGQHPEGTPLRIAVLACSIGMEVYSIKWTLRGLANTIDIQLLGLDIDASVLDIARNGVYPLSDFPYQFDRLTPAERNAICPTVGDAAVVSEKLRAGIQWLPGDAGSPTLIKTIGLQDIVVANRFLCHLEPQQATDCLRNITHLVSPGGYIFVTGVDLAIRARVMLEEGFHPVTQNIEAIHNGDVSLFNGWPWECWGLEPFDKQRADWAERYAMIYRKPSKAAQRQCSNPVKSSSPRRKTA